MFSLISAWINDWENHREAGDLRRNRAHYDVIVMTADISEVNLTYQWVVEAMYQTNNTEHYHYDYTNPTITEKRISDLLDIWIM